MSWLQKTGNLKTFAAISPGDLERELAGELRGDITAIEKVEHVAHTVLGRVRELREEAAKSFHQRDREIEAITAAFICGVPVLLLGPPGTAKSAVVRRVAELCGLASGENESSHGSAEHGGYFEYLLTNHTMPEELFGGPDLKELAQGRIRRVTAGKLPCAEIAFLDEVFRGGGHILNTLLTVINEKRFDSGSGAVHVPLLGLIGASNEPPREADLEAFFDRFPVRLQVASVLERRGNLQPADAFGPGAQLVKFAVNAERARLADAWNDESAVQLRHQGQKSCTNDFRFARMYLLRCLTDSVERSPRFEQFMRLFHAIRERTRLSDRSLGQLWLFAAALDLLRSDNPTGRFPECSGHLDVFRYAGRSGDEVRWLDDLVTRQTQGIQHGGSL